jgi:hypothetical protein
MAGDTFFFFMTTRSGMVLRPANEHFHKAEVATESCEGKVAACFCQGYGISDGHIPHLTFVKHISGCVDEYQGAVVKPRGPRKAVDADRRNSGSP